jgi:CCR4-NOT transcriptional complex subunit CAF120
MVRRTHYLQRSGTQDIWRQGQFRPPFVNGQMEGWIHVRVAAQSEWRKLWMVVSQGKGLPPLPDAAPMAPQEQARKIRFFRNTPVTHPPNALIEFYSSHKESSTGKPVLTMRAVSQAYAVYPIRPEYTHYSTLVKMVGTIGNEDPSLAVSGTESWLWIVLPGGNNCVREMLKWIVGKCSALSHNGAHVVNISLHRDP